MTDKAHAYDVFISYRWITPDQEWVRQQLYPALIEAGLKVCLDTENFLPGRESILEMSRAGEESQHVLCILSPEYFEEGKNVAFESLAARRRDIDGRNSFLIPLIFRQTEIPPMFRGLIPIDWRDPNKRAQQWRRLLEALGASNLDAPCPKDDSEIIYIQDIRCIITFHDDLKKAKHEYHYEIKNFVRDSFEFKIPKTGESEISEIVISDNGNEDAISKVAMVEDCAVLVFSRLSIATMDVTKKFSFSFVAPTKSFLYSDDRIDVAFYRAEQWNDFRAGAMKITIKLPEGCVITDHVSGRGGAQVNRLSITFREEHMEYNKTYAFPIFFHRIKTRGNRRR